MPTPPESWTSHLRDEFDRYAETLLRRDVTQHRNRSTGSTSLSSADLERVRDEVVAIATTDTGSLAFRVLLTSGTSAHVTDPCPTCDAAIRLAWGASKRRRALGLPASDDIADYHATVVA